jgi:hypothetical protein
MLTDLLRLFRNVMFRRFRSFDVFDACSSNANAKNHDVTSRFALTVMPRAPGP